jgi:hypothetical protein
VGVQKTALLELPPGETLADLALGTEPAKRHVRSSFRLSLCGREPLLRSLIPEKRLPRFDLTADLA